SQGAVWGGWGGARFQHSSPSRLGCFTPASSARPSAGDAAAPAAAPGKGWGPRGAGWPPSTSHTPPLGGRAGGGGRPAAGEGGGGGAEVPAQQPVAAGLLHPGQQRPAVGGERDGACRAAGQGLGPAGRELALDHLPHRQAGGAAGGEAPAVGGEGQAGGAI